MSSMHPLRYALAVCTVLAPIAAQAETHFNIKPGLWETTTTIKTEGMPAMPEMNMQGMSPQQRAQIEAAMSRMNQPHTDKSCITEEQIKQGPDFGSREEPSCKRDISTNSSSEWAITETCTGDHPRTIKARFKAPNSETITGESEVDASSSRGNDIHSKATFQGKWLGSDCGAVKPMEMPKKK